MNNDYQVQQDGELPDAPSPTLEEQLIDQITQLTNNQNMLMQTIAELKAKNDDPFLAFRTPDPVKNLPTFGGNKKETSAWLEDAENTLDLFKEYRGKPMYSQIVRAIKNKIIGEAKGILIAAGNPNSWDEIKSVLINSYGDRRDLTTHIQSLFYTNQGKKTLQEYYNKIKTIDTAIKSTAATIDDYKSSTKAINSLVSLMTLTRFIDGLSDELSFHVRSYRPESLEEAYEITVQYSNAAYRQKLNKKPTQDRQWHADKRTQSQPQGQVPSSLQNPQAKFNTQQSQNLNNKFNGSGRFRNQKNNLDDDVSMRTAKSKIEVNNHNSCATQNECGNSREKEYDTPHQPDDSVLESDDDEYLVDDELNFLEEETLKGKT